MAQPVLARRRRGTAAAVLTAAMLPARLLGGEAPVAASQPPSEPSALIAPAAAQAEAIPEFEPPQSPTFVRPEVAAAVPDPVRPFMSLKKATGKYTLLAGQGDDLGLDMMDGAATFAFRELSSLTVTPGAGVVFLDGPVRTDLPPRLYSGQVEFRWFGQVSRQVAYELAVTPSVYTDSDNLGSDAFRIPARALGFVFFSPETQVALGVVYLDREDVSFLPAVGLIHSFRDDVKLELVFPRPRLLKRFDADGGGETWGYAGGEFGGGSWAVERQDGRDDVATYSDYRLLFGLERRQSEAWTAAIEAGYVFGRELEYESARGDYDPDDTFLLRLALSH